MADKNAIDGVRISNMNDAPCCEICETEMSDFEARISIATNDVILCDNCK